MLRVREDKKMTGKKTSVRGRLRVWSEEERQRPSDPSTVFDFGSVIFLQIEGPWSSAAALLRTNDSDQATASARRC
jgi:hypothetical protein